jgi:Ca2+-binding RTX toxin-like protein
MADTIVAQNEIDVSPAAQNLETIQGNLTVAGQGAGTLNVDDQAGSIGRSYSLAANSLSWGGPAAVGYDLLGSLVVSGTPFNDTVAVQSLPGNPVTLHGGLGFNTLVGPDTANTWLLAQSGGVEGTLNNSLVFDSFGELAGGPSTDRFVVPDGAYIPEFLSGGDTSGRNNTLDLSAYTSPLTVHVFSSVYGGNVLGVVRAFALCPNVIGGQGNDRFVIDQGFGLTTLDGGPGNNTLDLSPYYYGPQVIGILQPNGGYVAGEFESFSNVQNLITGSTNDSFAFRGTAYLDGTIDAGGGSSTLNDSESAASVTVNLQTGLASYVDFQGGAAPRPGGITGIQNFAGGPGSANTLIGPDSPNTWTITGPNIGTVNRFNFTLFQVLTGGAADDTFVFSQGGSVSGAVDGGGGTNALDYSQYSGNITVDLALNLASLVNQGAVGSVVHIAIITGSIGTDLLVGDANANVLIGGNGRNILIGGAGPDTVDASRATSDNILIGGRTDYDNVLAALVAILAEWTRADLAFRDRISDLTRGSNSTGARPLNVVNGQLILLTPARNPTSTNGTVHADTSPDTLIGSDQIDPATGRRAHNWFFLDFDDMPMSFLRSSDRETRVT